MSCSWELSPLYRHGSTVPVQDSHLVSSHANRIILRTTQDLAIERTWLIPGVSTEHSSSVLRDNNNAHTNVNPSKVSSHKQTRDAITHKPPTTTAASPSTDLTFAVSSNSPHYILAFSPKHKTAYVIHPREQEPVARLDIGSEGATAVAWSGSGDCIMAWSALHLRLSLYRLAAPQQPLHIHSPKLAYPAGCAFRPGDARYLAVVERHSSKDHIGIYDCHSWSLLRHFPLPSPSSDVADLAWSPCGRFIAIWEHVTDYVMHIYTPDGRLLRTFAPYSTLARTVQQPMNKTALRNQPIGQTSASDTRDDKESERTHRSTDTWVGLGVRTVSWHPSGNWLAIGGWDGKIRVLTRLSWASVAELTPTPKVSSPVHAWIEPTEWIERTRGKGIVPFDAHVMPYNPVSIRPDLARPNPRMGISGIAWSPSGRWLAAYSQTYPNTLWLFSFLNNSSTSSTSFTTVEDSSALRFRPRLHSIMVHNLPVRSFEWQPIDPNSGGSGDLLVIASAEKGFTMWRAPIRDLAEDQSDDHNDYGSESERDRIQRRGIAECVGVPSRAEFEPTSVRFAGRRGDALVLSDKNAFAVAYPVFDDAAAGGDSIVLERSRENLGDDSGEEERF